MAQDKSDKTMGVKDFIKEKLTTESFTTGLMAGSFGGAAKFVLTGFLQPINNIKNWQQFASGPHTPHPRKLNMYQAFMELIAEQYYLKNFIHYSVQTVSRKPSMNPDHPGSYYLKRISMADFYPLFKGTTSAIATQTLKGIMRGFTFPFVPPVAAHMVDMHFSSVKNTSRMEYNFLKALLSGFFISLVETTLLTPSDRFSVAKSTQQGVYAQQNLWKNISLEKGMLSNIRVFYKGALVSFLKTFYSLTILFSSQTPVTEMVNHWYEVPEGARPPFSAQAISSMGMAIAVALCTAFIDLLKTNGQASGALHMSMKNTTSFYYQKYGLAGFGIGVPAKFIMILLGYYPLALLTLYFSNTEEHVHHVKSQGDCPEKISLNNNLLFKPLKPTEQNSLSSEIKQIDSEEPHRPHT